MSWFVALPFFMQGGLHLVDEFYFHRQRSPLPRWELWSHPFDTALVLAIYGVCWLAPFHWSSVALYGSLFALSCFSVTKDEWVHKQFCTAGEHWVHSLLFVVHPIVLSSAGLYGLSRFSDEVDFFVLPWFLGTYWIFESFIFATGLVLCLQLIQGARLWRQ